MLAGAAGRRQSFRLCIVCDLGSLEGKLVNLTGDGLLSCWGRGVFWFSSGVAVTFRRRLKLVDSEEGIRAFCIKEDKGIFRGFGFVSVDLGVDRFELAADEFGVNALSLRNVAESLRAMAMGIDRFGFPVSGPQSFIVSTITKVSLRDRSGPRELFTGPTGSEITSRDLTGSGSLLASREDFPLLMLNVCLAIIATCVPLASYLISEVCPVCVTSKWCM